ncbi:MAG: hypothetical protein EXS09_01460 [Gemmataceae bacterium]|nr:hypothetical protein [Gemmataceae bacterium]
MFKHFAILLVAFQALAAEPKEITLDLADARLKRAFALARESNDDAIIEKVLEYRDGVKRSFGRKDLVAAERLVRDAEESVGLDAGGETMLGLRIARIDAETQKKLDSLRERLEKAMNANDIDVLGAVISESEKILGDNAGLPDVRRKGDQAKALPVKPAGVAELFLKVIQVDPRSLKALSSGKPVGDTLPRGYASVVHGCLTIRPLVEKHFRDKLEIIDGLIKGCCATMIALQVQKGHFKFPDMRGKHIRFGEMIEKIVANDPDAIEDGWLIVPDPEGGSQIDASECATALLRAGTILKNDDWKRSGLKAADWAKSAPLVSNFNYNAFSVSLLCEAHRVSGEKKYLDAAWKKYQFGVAPGQVSNGRWIDTHNSRTVYHVLLLRSMHDLLETLPAGKDREAVEKSARRALLALVEEAEKLGAPSTSMTICELDRHSRLTKDCPQRVSEILQIAASAAIQRCSSGGRVRTGAPLPELAAAAQIWEK